MTNLSSLFEIFNGQDIKLSIDQTLALFRTYRKQYFIECEDQVKPFAQWLHDLENCNHPYIITNGESKISILKLEAGYPKIPAYLATIACIKSEMMGCASHENFEEVKELYHFWEGIELSLKQVIK